MCAAPGAVHYADEIAIYLNGAKVGDVPLANAVAAASAEDMAPDANNAWSDPHTVVLPDNLVSDSGVNLLTFRNKYNPPNDFIWSVRNVALQATAAAELPPAAEAPAPNDDRWPYTDGQGQPARPWGHHAPR